MYSGLLIIIITELHSHCYYSASHSNTAFLVCVSSELLRTVLRWIMFIKPTEVDVLLRDIMYMQLPSIYDIIDSSATPLYPLIILKLSSKKILGALRNKTIHIDYYRTEQTKATNYTERLTTTIYNEHATLKTLFTSYVL